MTAGSISGSTSGDGLAALDQAPDEQLRTRLRSCCAAATWVERIAAGRPYRSEAALLAASDRYTAELDRGGLAEALAGHPRIGETGRAHEADGRAAAWSRSEQAGVSGAETTLRHELAAANAAYERRFGHVYLVCAAGRDAAELLEVCRSRLRNDPATERGVVLDELARINRLRLSRLLQEWT
ncbi:MAG TPA: 2-oxo-4-hydroxy-4-carboxy-5-ureidoimidazoline decarboxylase [Solirubrobacteraceae bacterium]|nr:2-oxo-4-hydroxy-4-carboxy-5-ureidoimidazoline decarboxylase [Solirubrobacteraceae bacterium]